MIHLLSTYSDIVHHLFPKIQKYLNNLSDTISRWVSTSMMPRSTPTLIGHVSQKYLIVYLTDSIRISKKNESISVDDKNSVLLLHADCSWQPIVLCCCWMSPRVVLTSQTKNASITKSSTHYQKPVSLPLFTNFTSYHSSTPSISCMKDVL